MQYLVFGREGLEGLAATLEYGSVAGMSNVRNNAAYLHDGVASPAVLGQSPLAAVAPAGDAVDAIEAAVSVAVEAAVEAAFRRAMAGGPSPFTVPGAFARMAVALESVGAKHGVRASLLAGCTNFLDKRLLLLLGELARRGSPPAPVEQRSLGDALSDFLACVGADGAYFLPHSGRYELLFEREGLEALAGALSAARVSAADVRALLPARGFDPATPTSGAPPSPSLRSFSSVTLLVAGLLFAVAAAAAAVAAIAAAAAAFRH
jgi:hypothetical protein